MTPAKGASGMNLLAGIWLFISSWVYGAYTLQSAWNNWIVAALIVILAAIRLLNPMTTLWASWTNCALGIWTFASPGIFGYQRSNDHAINSIAVGIIVFALAMISVAVTPHITSTGPSHEMPAH